MSACPQSSSVLSVVSHPPAPAGACWIDLATAAARSGKSRGHIKRLCGSPKYCPGEETLAMRGLAKLVTPPGGGKPTWHVREDADPQGGFAPVKFPEQIDDDLRDVPKAKRDEAMRRRSILLRWERHCAEALAAAPAVDRNGATIRFLEQLHRDDGVTISRATLYNWNARWRAASLAGLVDQRGSGDETPPAAEDPFIAELKALYLTLRRRSKAVCYDMASDKAKEQGWPVASYRTACRALENIPRAIVLLRRHGESAFNDGAVPCIEGDYAQLASNEVWCGDHHQFDVICRYGPPCGAGENQKLVRPWLTAWQDLRSRKLVGWSISAADPNTDAILAALDDAINPDRQNAGVPAKVIVDNGKDYDSFALQGRTKKERREKINWLRRRITPRGQGDEQTFNGVFASLRAEVSFCWPYHGQSKPIERFFGTMERRFGVQWLTYTGNNPENKPEDLDVQIERGNAPLLADFIARFAQWIEEDYHQAAHFGNDMHGKCPNVVFAENLRTKRVVSRELCTTILSKPTKPVTVHKNGVTYKGVQFGQHEEALMRLLGQDVCLRVGSSAASVEVWSQTNDTFICIAPSNRRLSKNASRDDLTAAVKEIQRDKKVIKDFYRVKPRIHEGMEERISRQAASRAAAQQSPDPELPPPSIQPVRSDLEAQLPALRAAIETQQLKPAVGAELSANYAALRTALRSGDDGDTSSGDARAALEDLRSAMRGAGGEEDPS